MGLYLPHETRRFRQGYLRTTAVYFLLFSSSFSLSISLYQIFPAPIRAFLEFIAEWESSAAIINLRAPRPRAFFGMAWSIHALGGEGNRASDLRNCFTDQLLYASWCKQLRVSDAFTRSITQFQKRVIWKPNRNVTATLAVKPLDEYTKQSNVLWKRQLFSLFCSLFRKAPFQKRTLKP